MHLRRVFDPGGVWLGFSGGDVRVLKEKEMKAYGKLRWDELEKWG